MAILTPPDQLNALDILPRDKCSVQTRCVEGNKRVCAKRA
jgi:hypothetical protein